MPFSIRSAPWLFIVGLCFLAAKVAAAPAGLPPGPTYAWYREDGLQAAGADVTAWENAVTNGAPRHLSRVAGRPRAVRVRTPGGGRTIVRFDGKSALWQAAASWGTLAGERTVVVYARMAPSAGPGVLLDGSTRSGRAPVRWQDGAWHTTATASTASSATQWQAHTFVFGPGQTPLGGFILGANVAAQEGLACDVAEVLVYPRALAGGELRDVATYLGEKWGKPVELPGDQQPALVRRAEDPRIFWTTLRRRGDDGVHTYRIPGLATTTNGTLIAVFDARNRSGADLPGDIDVAMMRSTDDGATWSLMRRIIDYDATVAGSRGNGVGDPAVLVDGRTGAILVVALWSKGARAWHGSGPGLTPDETGQLVLVKSLDDGLTWSKPVSLTPQVKDPAWRLCFNGPGNGIQLRDGTLVFPAQYKRLRPAPGAKEPQLVSHSCFIASRDGGESWTISPAAIPEGVPTSESAIAELADGSLLLSMRDESRSGKRAWARWSWRGEVREGSWSEPWFTVTDPTCMASLIRHPHGELILSNPNHATRRVALTIRSSTDGGRTWSAGRVLDPGGAMYSCLTVLRDGRVGVLYESGDAERLVFARFPLEWVQEGASAPTVPEARLERTGKFGGWMGRHEAKLAETQAGGVEILFLGDSITQNWETTGKAAWDRHFAPRAAGNYGFGGDSTQHVLWRVLHGEVDGLSPKVIVLLIGTNNSRHGDATPGEIADGVRAILAALAGKCPQSKVLLLGILPRGADAADPWRRRCEAVNALLPGLADSRRVHFLNVNARFLAADGTLSRDLFPDLLHLSGRGYELLAEALVPKLDELAGGK